MRKTFGKNKHQKAAHRPGEQKISREEVAELLMLSASGDPDERLVAAQLLCPCHVRGAIPAVGEAISRMLSDTDRRVRFAAWHTFEDGGLPEDPDLITRLEQLLQQEQDAGVRRFAARLLEPVLNARKQVELARMRLQTATRQQRGKCDFCSARGAMVVQDLETLIPTSDWPRPALICERCAQTHKR